MDIDAIHKALANPVRREILVWLKEPEAYFSEQEFPLASGVCAGQIDARCGMSQSTVSAHLATLHKAGLVTSKRVGQWSGQQSAKAVGEEIGAISAVKVQSHRNQP